MPECLIRADHVCDVCQQKRQRGTIVNCLRENCPLPHMPLSYDHKPLARVTIAKAGNDYKAVCEGEWPSLGDPLLLVNQDGSAVVQAAFHFDQTKLPGKIVKA
jgi:hypothetical protein